jgi:hypothetical protein
MCEDEKKEEKNRGGTGKKKTREKILSTLISWIDLDCVLHIKQPCFLHRQQVQ